MFPARIPRPALATAMLAALLPLGTAAGAAAPPSTAGPTLAGAAAQEVRWGGVRFLAPADWPVYDLGREPARCVRFDVHAVFLGAAGPAARCPSRLIGRTDAVHVEPATAAAAERVALAAAGTGAQRWAPGGGGGPALDGREIVTRLDALGVVVTASYGARASVAQAILSSFGTSTLAAPAPAEPSPAPPGEQPTRLPAAPGPLASSSALTSSSALAPGVYTGPGFDACTAPSTTSMTAWLASPFRSIGIYLGGGNRACADGNLSASWVGSVTRQGWRLAPLYVGYQAPCVDQGGLAHFSTNPGVAAAQAAASARDAVGRARYFGLPSGSPIYFDLESYDSRDILCRAAVLAFTNAWTLELHRLGFRSAVYSGSASGIRDMAAATGSAGFTPPDGVWMARWDGVAGVFGDPYVGDQYWPNHQRLHQYRGGHDETWGGVTINIDSNYDDGLVVTGGPGGGLPGYGFGVVGPGATGFHTTGSWHSGAPQGVRGSMLWTYSSGTVATASATWTPVLSPGRYDVSVYVPSDHAGGHGRYTVSGATAATVVIDQGARSNQYVPLGRFASDWRGRLTVRLTNDADPPQAHTVGADAVRFGWAGPLVPGLAWLAPADLNGDGRADVAVWRPSNGTWYIRGYSGVRYGIRGDVPVAGDYLGDRRADLAVWRPSNGRWYVRGQPSVQWGRNGDIPVAADFNGDGRVDIAVWRASTGVWYLRGVGTARWGIAGDVPVAADYNGDGRAEIATWRPSNGRWYLPSRLSMPWGVPGDIPTPARLHSRGGADVAVWRPSNGGWYVRGVASIRWGLGGDIAVAGDITGGGLADHAVWRPSNGIWYIRNEAVIRWGVPGDIPV